MCGVKNESIKKRLLGEKDLTFDKAVELAAAMETAARDVAGMAIPDNDYGGATNVNFVNERQRKSGRGNITQLPRRDNLQRTRTCLGCGYNKHTYAQGRYKDCRLCKKKVISLVYVLIITTKIPTKGYLGILKVMKMVVLIQIHFIGILREMSIIKIILKSVKILKIFLTTCIM